MAVDERLRSAWPSAKRISNAIFAGVSVSVVMVAIEHPKHQVRVVPEGGMQRLANVLPFLAVARNLPGAGGHLLHERLTIVRCAEPAASHQISESWRLWALSSTLAAWAAHTASSASTYSAVRSRSAS